MAQNLPDRIKMGNDYYIDTDAGADDPTADGSQARPFKSLSYAFI